MHYYPTCYDDFDAICSAIKTWLEVHIPDWCGFQILGRHPYLGPDLGPEAGQELWDKAISKHWERVLRIPGLGLSTYFSILAYNTYALSCLEYIQDAPSLDLLAYFIIGNVVQISFLFQ